MIFAASFATFYPLRSFGASGDYAAGYLNIASRLLRGQVTVDDPVVGVVGDKEIGAFLPSHYVPVDAPTGTLRPKYAPGVTLLLAAPWRLFG